MTSKILQKQDELIYLHNFQQHSSFNFEIIEENESPDFIIKYNNKKIGFEVTEYFIDEEKKGGSHLKKIESGEQRIINNGRKDYIKKLKSPLRVYVTFRKGLNLSKKNGNQISTILSECLSNIELDIWERVNILEKYDSNNLSDYFSFFQVMKLPEKLKNHWDTMDWGIETDITKSRIIKKIREKEKKLGEYKRTTENNWLLIVSDGRYPSSMLNTNQKLNFKVDSGFNKIFFLLYPHGKIIKIK